MTSEEQEPRTSPGPGRLGRGGVRALDRLFDALGARPLGIGVFFASVALLLYLQVGLQGSIRAQAVAGARQVDHPARVSSFVTEVYVRPGDKVSAGAPLLSLSDHFVDREISRVDVKIEKLLYESRLAQARLLIDEQRWLRAELRQRPDRPSLETPTEELYAQELVVLQTRREQLSDDRESLTIKAARDGRVVGVFAVGASVAEGESVAAVSPEYAEEIVAYVPASTEPASIGIGAAVQIAQPTLRCDGQARVLRRGAAVAEAPGQLRTLLRFPVHGMPVFISVPEDCELGIGQVLTVEFPRAAVM